MNRVRTITKAVEELKAKDPNTAITGYYIRNLVKAKEIPCIMTGSRVLVDMDVLEHYISNNFSFKE